MAIKDIEQALIDFATKVKDDPSGTDASREAATELHSALSGGKDDADSEE